MTKNEQNRLVAWRFWSALQAPGNASISSPR